MPVDNCGLEPSANFRLRRYRTQPAEASDPAWIWSVAMPSNALFYVSHHGVYTPNRRIERLSAARIYAHIVQRRVRPGNRAHCRFQIPCPQHSPLCTAPVTPRRNCTQIIGRWCGTSLFDFGFGRCARDGCHEQAPPVDRGT